MVDAAVGLQRRVEAVERTVRGVASSGGLVRIGQNARRDKGRIDMIVLVDVKVPGQDHELFGFAHFADLRHHQLGALLAGLHPDMVHMQVEEPEAALGLQVEEMAPRADARQRGVPALVRTVGDLRKPEMAIVQQAETLLL